MMEKITEWRWNGQTDAFWYADGDTPKVLVYRNDSPPSDDQVALLDSRYWTEAGYNAAWMLQSLRSKVYDKLMPNMRAAYDFLNARLGG